MKTAHWQGVLFAKVVLLAGAAAFWQLAISGETTAQDDAVAEVGAPGDPPTPHFDPDKGAVLWPVDLGCPPPYGGTKP